MPKVYTAPALEKGLAILELLAGRGTPVGMPEIAQDLGRSKAEIYRMLMVLESHGYIERGEQDDRYQITERLFELGMRNAPKRQLHDAALPVMQAFAAATFQSCHVGVVSGDHIVIVARAESSGPISFSVSLGYRVPLLESTSGRVIFGFQTPEKQNAWVKRLQADIDGPSLRKFVAESKAVAKRGYAIEPSRLTDGIHDIGAPIRGAQSDDAVASLTVPYVSHRHSTTTLDDLVPQVVEAAKEISRRMRKL
jgi:DNA-binding IclR family transcriptional regulator